jgi:hypothetical protein
MDSLLFEYNNYYKTLFNVQHLPWNGIFKRNDINNIGEMYCSSSSLINNGENVLSYNYDIYKNSNDYNYNRIKKGINNEFIEKINKNNENILNNNISDINKFNNEWNIKTQLFKEKCKELYNYGFDEIETREALIKNCGNKKNALKYLIKENRKTIDEKISENINEMIELGFNELESKEALLKKNNNIKNAIKYLVECDKFNNKFNN